MQRSQTPVSSSGRAARPQSTPFPITLLSCQTSEQVVFPGHKGLSRRVQDKAGGAGHGKGIRCLGVSSSSHTISPWIEDLAVHLRSFSPVASSGCGKMLLS